MGQTVYPPTAAQPPPPPPLELIHHPTSALPTSPLLIHQPTAIPPPSIPTYAPTEPPQPLAQPYHPNPQDSNFPTRIYTHVASGYLAQPTYSPPVHPLSQQSSYITPSVVPAECQSEKVVAYPTPSPAPVGLPHHYPTSQKPSSSTDYYAYATGYPAHPTVSPLSRQSSYITSSVVPAECQAETVIGNPMTSPAPVTHPYYPATQEPSSSTDYAHPSGYPAQSMVHPLSRQSSYIPSLLPAELPNQTVMAQPIPSSPHAQSYYHTTQQSGGSDFAYGSGYAAQPTYHPQSCQPAEVAYSRQSSYTTPLALVPTQGPSHTVIANPVPVVGLKYCLPHPVDLMIVRKLTLSNDFTVMDVARTPIFKVKGKVVGDKRMLLDAAGIPVISLNTKLLSMYKRWQVFKGASTHPTDLIFSARTSSVVQLKTKLNVYLANRVTEDFSDFKVEGSWSDGSCTVYLGETPTIAARMNKMDSAQSYFLGKDTFVVTVSPNIDYAFVVALILILDAINSSNSNLSSVANAAGLFFGIPPILKT